MLVDMDMEQKKLIDSSSYRVQYQEENDWTSQEIAVLLQSFLPFFASEDRNGIALHRPQYETYQHRLHT